MNRSHVFSVAVCLFAGIGCTPGALGEGETDSATGTGTEGGLDESASAGSGTNGDGDSAGTSGDGTTGDGTTGDGTTGDGDGTTTGDGTTGDGTTGDGTTGDGDGTTGDGDGTSGDGDGTTGDGTTGDGDGVACPDPGLDSDNDGIPDCDDPFPFDPNLPGVGAPNVIYAHTSNTLFTMDPMAPYTITQVGAFTFDQSPGSITDIALDQYGVLYAVSFSAIYVCDPQSAACIWLGALSDSFNGLTLVPAGVVNPDRETIVGISAGGNWYAIDIGNMSATATLYGSYGAGLSNAGDVYSITGVGTYGATSPAAVWSCDPATGTAQTMIAPLTGYGCVYGLAGWQDSIFAFNCGGEVVRIDPVTGVATELTNGGQSWWGAGVRTLIPM